jgi:hypothetical protein
MKSINYSSSSKRLIKQGSSAQDVLAKLVQDAKANNNNTNNATNSPQASNGNMKTQMSDLTSPKNANSIGSKLSLRMKSPIYTKEPTVNTVNSFANHMQGNFGDEEHAGKFRGEAKKRIQKTLYRPQKDEINKTLQQDITRFLINSSSNVIGETVPDFLTENFLKSTRLMKIERGAKDYYLKYCNTVKKVYDAMGDRRSAYTATKDKRSNSSANARSSMFITVLDSESSPIR